MLQLTTMTLAAIISLVLLDVGMPYGALGFVGFFAYFLVAQFLLNFVAFKFRISVPERINSRGLSTFILFIFYSGVNGVLILVFAASTKVFEFGGIYEPFVCAGSIMLVRQLFD